MKALFENYFLGTERTPREVNNDWYRSKRTRGLYIVQQHRGSGNIVKRRQRRKPRESLADTFLTSSGETERRNRSFSFPQQLAQQRKFSGGSTNSLKWKPSLARISELDFRNSSPNVRRALSSFVAMSMSSTDEEEENVRNRIPTLTADLSKHKEDDRTAQNHKGSSTEADGISETKADAVFLKDAIGLDSVVGTRQNTKEHLQAPLSFPITQQQKRPQNLKMAPERSKCLAFLQVQRIDLPTLCRNLKYEFHTGGEGSSAAGANDNPTVGQMAQEMLSDELDMPMERLMEQFEVQLQIRDSDMEPEMVFVDMNKRRWRDIPIEHRGHYKAILHPKTSSPINNNGHLTQSHKCFESEQQRLITLANEKVPKRGQSKNMGDVGQPQRLREDTDNWETKPQRLREDTDNWETKPQRLREDNDNWETKPQRLREDTDNWETKPQRLREDTDNWETKERFYLSENGSLGNLYDAHTDNFVNCHDLGFMRNIVAMRTQTEQSRPTTRERSIIEVDQLGSLDERLQMLGMEQKLSVISRLADFGGDSPLGQFLMAASQSDGFNPTNSFGIIHIVPKKTISLKLNDQQIRSTVLKQQSLENATHFVQSICFGSLIAAIVILDEHRSVADMDISTVKRLTLIRIRKAPMASSDSAILSSLNKFVRIRVFVNPSVRIVGTDLTFTNGLDLFADVPQQAASINHGIGHPITFSLMPLSEIVDKSKEPTLLPVPQSGDFAIVERIQSYVQIVDEFENELRKAEKVVNEFAHCFSEDQWNSARQLCQRFVMLKNSFAVLLRNCVVDLRMGAMENEMNVGEFVAGGQPMDALEETVGIFEECSQHLIELCDSITNRKVELIRQLEAKGILYVGRGNRHLPDVLMDHEESHKMPSLHFVLFFYPPETPPDETSPDLEQFYWQCLGQLFQMADRGKSCVFVDLELLLDGEHSATEVPEGIRSMDGFPKIGARLVKLRGEQLLTADCVAEETRKLELCIARIKNSQRTDIGVERPSDRRVLPCSLPCPLCKNFGGRCPNSDFLWGCDDCGQTLTFVKQPKAPITHFFCACGRTPADEFAFRCADIKTHGYSFKHFASKSLMDKELDRLNNRGDVNILLLGETGGGKSTLINALVNYLKHATMEDALGENNIDWLIPARFSTEEYDSSGYSMPKDVFVGEMTKDECLLPGKSQTKFPKAYIIPSKDGNKIRLIDAPGIGDTGGTEEDNVNFSNTLSFISELAQLHGICILLRPNHTRLSPAFKYCIDGLLTYLHKNAAQNIIFVFTFARGSCYSMGKTRELLVDVLRPIEKEHFVTIPLHRDRIYCMDNEAFEKLCLIKKGGIRYSPKNMAYFSESWGQAERECQRMLEYVTKLEPHRIWETLSLNEARRTIMDLTHPLAMISQSIQNNLIRINDLNQAIGEGEETEPKLETVEFVPLTFPRTVCTSTRCTDVKTSGGGEIVLYKRRCHERCYLDGVVAESFPNESLKKCAAMGGGNICTVVECGCDWSVHMHIRYDQLVIERAIDESMLKMFADKRETLSKLEALRQQMLRERELIYSKAALFSSFLKTWALKPFNDGMEAYIKLSIKDAERLIDSSEGESDNEVQMRKLEALRESLRLYNEQKQLIEKANANPSGLKAILPAHVKKLFEELCELPIFGKDIRQMYEAQQKTRQLQHNYYSEELAFGDKGFVPKPSRNRKANTQMEQYLNQLEKKGLECYFSEMKQRVFGEMDKRRARNERRQHSDDYEPSRHFSSKKRPPKRIGNLEKNKANANEPSFSEAFAVGGGYESGSTMCSSRSSTASSRRGHPKLSLSTTAANHQRNLTFPVSQCAPFGYEASNLPQLPSSSHRYPSANAFPPSLLPRPNQRPYWHPTSFGKSLAKRGDGYNNEQLPSMYDRRHQQLSSTTSSSAMSGEARGSLWGEGDWERQPTH